MPKRPEPTEWMTMLAKPSWVMIGDPSDRSLHPRWPHERYLHPFSVRGRSLSVTAADVGQLLEHGRYGQAIRRDHHARQLRGEDQMAHAVRAIASGYDPLPLAFDEARLICLLLGGRLPEETEVELLIPTQGSSLPAPVWTQTPWSNWSYRMTSVSCAGDPWRANADRRLPSGNDANRHRVAIFDMDNPCRRRPVAINPSESIATASQGIAWLVSW